MNTVGPRYPTATIAAGTGVNGQWATPTGIFDAGGTTATSGYFLDVDDHAIPTDALPATGFGFAIPATAIIDGILVEMSFTGGNLSSPSMGLLKASTSAGSTRTGTGSAPTSFGSSSDLWGTTWTPAEINNSGFGAATSFSASHSPSDASVSVDYIRITVYWHSAPADVPKRYLYKVYSAAGNFLGKLPNVSSEFSFPQDINTSGSQITVTCGVTIDTAPLQSTDTWTDESGGSFTDESGNALLTEGGVNFVSLGIDDALIKNGNKLIITEVGYYNPNGKIVFRGVIEKWSASFGGYSDDTIKIKAYSDGSDLDEYLLLGSPFTYTLDQSQTVFDSSSTVTQSGDKGFFYNYFGQSFTVGTGVTNVGGISLLLNGAANVTVSLYSSSSMSTLLASSSQNVSASATEVRFSFANHVIVAPGDTLFFAVTVAAGQDITIYFQNSNVYAGGTYYSASYAGGGGGGWGADSTRDLWFKTFSTSGQTTATFTGQDPSTGMLKAFIDDYRSRGGLVNYAPGTIDATGLTLTYTMTTNTILEGIKAMLSLSPDGFYFYVDVGTNTLYFKQASTTADIIITKGRNIDKIELTATIESVKNSVYVSGGVPSGGSANIYKTYQDPSSIARYRQKLLRRSDNRVTLSATADAIGNSAIAELKDEQFETTIIVTDKTMDISSLHVGQVVGFRNFGSFVDGLLMQIVRVEYGSEQATLTLGILPKRQSPEIDRITRELVALQTIANPTTPS